MPNDENKINDANDFEVTIAQTEASTPEDSGLDTKYKRLEKAAMESFMNNASSISSVLLNEGQSPEEDLTYDEIIELGTSPQTSLTKTQRIAARNMLLINTNDLIGRYFEIIRTNINTEYKLIYSHQQEGRNKKKKFAEAAELIHGFNDEIKIEKLIRDSICTAISDGNWIGYLKSNKDSTTVDSYPLGVAEISQYEVGGEPIVQFNIQNLRSRLQKTYRKTKKNKALFYENINKEVEANYPKEIVEAFKSGESYVNLDHRYSGVIRINNMNRPYGCSPILRAYLPLRIIQNLENADDTNSKARARKVIAQIMRKELIQDDPRRDTFPQQSYAHQTLASAFQNKSMVLVTCPPTVEKLAYIEPSADQMTSSDTYTYYRSKVLSTLGISFLLESSSQSVSTGTISISQLMKTIDSIAEQLEDILFKWYRQVLIDNGYDPFFAPHIKVLNSELMEMDMKKSLSEYFYNTLGASRDTAFSILGIDVKDEAEKRKSENELGYDDIFLPYSTSYTKSSDSDTTTTENTEGGRPEGDDNDLTTKGKKDYDKVRNDNT